MRVAPAGELDIATTPHLESAIRELLEAGFDDLIVDLSQLEFLDSSGLRVILSLQTAAEHDGYRFRIRRGPPAVQRVFELTGAIELIEFDTPAMTHVTRPLFARVRPKPDAG